MIVGRDPERLGRGLVGVHGAGPGRRRRSLLVVVVAGLAAAAAADVGPVRPRAVLPGPAQAGRAGPGRLAVVVGRRADPAGRPRAVSAWAGRRRGARPAPVPPTTADDPIVVAVAGARADRRRRRRPGRRRRGRRPARPRRSRRDGPAARCRPRPVLMLAWAVVLGRPAGCGSPGRSGRDPAADPRGGPGARRLGLVRRSTSRRSGATAGVRVAGPVGGQPEAHLAGRRRPAPADGRDAARPRRRPDAQAVDLGPAPRAGPRPPGRPLGRRSVQRLVQAVFFFHPAVHLANWIIDQLREYACDDAALAAVQGLAARLRRGVPRRSSAGPSSGPPSPSPGARAVRVADADPPPAAPHPRQPADGPRAALAPADARPGGDGPGRPALRPAARRRRRTARRADLGAGRDAARPRPTSPACSPSGRRSSTTTAASSAGKPAVGRSCAVAYSPDGRTLATAGEDAAIVLRDAATGRGPARLEGHADAVTCLAFSPDGKTLASAGYDRTVRLWDVATGRPPGHARRATTSWVFAVAFSPDGRTLASAGSDKTVRLWDVATARPSGHARRPRPRRSGPWPSAPTARPLASAGADRVGDALGPAPPADPSTASGGTGGRSGPWPSAPTAGRSRRPARTARSSSGTRGPGRERATLTGHSDMVPALAFSPSGATLASGGLDATVKLWDPKTGRERATLAGHADGVSALAFAPGARRLATAGYDGTVRLWEAAAPTLSAAATPRLSRRGPRRRLRARRPGPLRDRLRRRPRRLRPARPACLAGPGLPGGGASLAVAPDGRTDRRSGGSTARSAWSTPRPAGRSRPRTATPARSVALAFGRGGAVLASGGADGTVDRSGTSPPDPKIGSPGGPGGPGRRPRGSRPTARTLAVAARGPSGEVALFDAGVGRAPRHRSTAGRRMSPRSPSRPTAGRSRRPGPTARSSCFDAATRAERAIAGPTRTAGRSPSRPTAGSWPRATASGEVVLWDAATGAQAGDPEGARRRRSSGVAFAPDGRTLASAAADRTVRLWNLGARQDHAPGQPQRRARLRRPGGRSRPTARPWPSAEVAYDSAGHIALWDVAARQVRATLHGHERGVASLAFSPDGKTLASSSWDRTIRLWDARTGEPRGEFAGHRGRRPAGVLARRQDAGRGRRGQGR